MIDAFRERPIPQRILLSLAGAVVFALLVAEGADTGFVPTAVAHVVCGALSVLALIVPLPWLFRIGASAVVASCALSVLTTQLTQRPEHTPGMTELSVLLLLIARSMRLPTLPRGCALAAGAAVAVALVPLRLPVDEYEPLYLLWPPVLLFAVVLMAVLGLYLRLLDAVRARDRVAVRQAQRLEHARELHDFVAHHVTAIVAQTKAVRFTTANGRGPEPAELDGMLARIEEAGAQALDSMRGMVSVLRDSGRTVSHPGADLTRLRDLTEGFPQTGPQVTLALDPRLAEKLPSELAATVYRVVQESLTNVRKHADAAEHVSVDVRVRADAADRLTVTVVDDGRSPGDPCAASGPSGQGFGLIGLAERVGTAGGTFTSGPQYGAGWEVAAELPLPAPPQDDTPTP